MIEINNVSFFLIALLRWFEIAAVLLLVGIVTFREISYLPALQLVKHRPTRVQILAAQDRHTVIYLRFLLYLLILLQCSVVLSRIFVMKGDILLALSDGIFGIIVGAKLFLIGLLLTFAASKSTWRGPLLFSLGSLLCLTGSFSGHAFASGEIHLVLTDWLHFTAVSVWAGGLLPLRDAAHRSRTHLEPAKRAVFLSRLIEVFSIWAILCVMTIVMTGSFNAMIYLESVDDILEAAYGKLLFIKLVIVSIAIGLGGVSRFYILPRLRKISANDSLKLGVLERQFHCVLSVEFVFVTLVLVVVSFLTQVTLP